MGSFLIAFKTTLLVIHFFVAIFLIIMIMLQSGKGSDIGTAFGAGNSQALFGPRGAATLFSKMTTICAIVFLLTSLSLATTSRFSASTSGDSIIKDQLKEGAHTEDLGDIDTTPTGIPVE